MLPSINLSADFNNQDSKKQIAALKSQMASLKDAIEDELYNISYDQLDANLKKKIDSIKESISQTSEDVAMVASSLRANYVTADEIYAKYATITNLNAAKADIASLNATVANLGSVYASYAWVEALDAVVANLRDVTVANLVAKAITTDNLSAITISGNQITAGTINANRLNLSTWGSTFQYYNAPILFNNLQVLESIDMSNGTLYVKNIVYV